MWGSGKSRFYFVLFFTVHSWFCPFKQCGKEVAMPPCGCRVGSETEMVGTVAGRKLIAIYKQQQKHHKIKFKQ